MMYASCCAGRVRAPPERICTILRCRATSASSIWSRPSCAPRSSTPPSGSFTVPWWLRRRPGRMRELHPAPPRPPRPLLEAARILAPPAVGAPMVAVRPQLHRRARGRGRYCGGRRGCEGRLSTVEAGGVSEELLGPELRRIREERGLTVEQLAEKRGVSATTIRDVERGAREARGDTVAKLARPLGLTFDEVWELQRRRR